MLDLPLFDRSHRELAARLEAFRADAIEPRANEDDEADPDGAGREVIAACARAGLLELFVPNGSLDLRAICLAREVIASSSGLADAVFAVQGLGSFPLLQAGSEPVRHQYLPRVKSGDAVAAFALTEAEAGSDVRALQTTARWDRDAYVIDGTKTLISNAGIADFYIVFTRLVTDGESRDAGPKISAFVVDAASPGLRVVRSIPLMAPHPIGELAFEQCRVPEHHRLGENGDGLQVALATLDFFRATVGAAACGLAGRALQETRQYVRNRRQFGQALADFQATKFALADMQTELDAARLLVYRTAWLKDHGAERVTREASIAKLFATEAAQRIVDRAVQLHGGIGVTRGVVVERLYREVRALRIYEGTSEIQRLVIADHMLTHTDH